MWKEALTVAAMLGIFSRSVFTGAGIVVVIVVVC